MEKILQTTLALLGLTPKEIKFFVTCFTIGPASINAIKKAAKLERSTAYLIAEDLLKRGFIEEDFKNYKKLLRTVEPKDLLRMVAARQRILGRQEIALQEQLPELNSLYQASDIRPKVRVFQGTKGIVSIQEDILSSSTEILLWTNQETEHQFFTDAFHKSFIETRLKRKIPIRFLAIDNKAGEKLLEHEATYLRKVTLLPKETTFSPETYLYENKIAILDYTKDIIGIIIESEPMAASQKALFELTWKTLSPQK